MSREDISENGRHGCDRDRMVAGLNYIYNKGLSPVTSWVWIPFVSDLRQLSGFHLGTQVNWLAQNNWKIVESGAKHHNPNPTSEIFGESH